MSTETTVGPHRRRARSRLSTLRSRVTVVAGLAVTLAIVAGVILLYLLQIQAVHRSMDEQLRTYATQIAQSAPNGDWPKVLSASTLNPDAQAQVIAADGTVLAATRTLVGLPAVYALPAGASTPIRLKAADGVLPGEVRAIGVRRTIAGRQVSIIAGTSTGQLTQLRAAFTSRLILGLPIILLISGAAVWLIVGRALRPVEQIRHAVTDITSADLSQRVPEVGTNDEIGQLARTMNDMLTRLEDSSRRQRRFVADASHELRSPLAAIRTTLEVGLTHPDRAPWPTLARRAADQSARLEELIQQLLLLARADEQNLADQAQPVDLGELLRQLHADTRAHDVKVDLDLVGNLTMLGNADHLRRLFTNVLDNALRHATSTVRISAAARDGQITIEITDDGPGIPAEDRDRIFERFVRLDFSRDRSRGTTGLGLAIAREIATAHGGSISATENPKGGACVVISLPSWTPPQFSAARTARPRPEPY